ncbi:MAG: ATP-dependent DNA helicase, partial [Bartonella sp.]|nr:ATP-dependent DNA helicase [Bartonella sp.]
TQKNQTETAQDNSRKQSAAHVEKICYGDIDLNFGITELRQQKNIEGNIIAKPVSDKSSAFSINDRIFHIKFGYGQIKAIDGNKLTIFFDKIGEKRVLDNFVIRA